MWHACSGESEVGAGLAPSPSNTLLYLVKPPNKFHTFGTITEPFSLAKCSGPRKCPENVLMQLWRIRVSYLLEVLLYTELDSLSPDTCMPASNISLQDKIPH